ncbi:MAG TPA: hypothetical protein VGO47_11125 [Chlamydiales bacterium]|nr:hypothetical protein [Chlamydiales bacterium]
MNEAVLGSLPKLTGNNPITGGLVSQPGGANNAPASNPGTKNIPPATTTGGAPAPTMTGSAPTTARPPVATVSITFPVIHEVLGSLSCLYGCLGNSRKRWSLQSWQWVLEF